MLKDPLSKKQHNKSTKVKVSHAYSVTERELFSEAGQILKRRKQAEEEKLKKKEDLVYSMVDIGKQGKIPFILCSFE